jgi:CheY-like chemotaxis protein
MTPPNETIAEKTLALAVDDDRNFLQSLRMMLRVGGFAETEGAGDVEQALAIIRRRRVDLIVSDWNMDPYDGLHLLRRVRAEPETAQIPFILVTASLSEDAWRGAIELGATDFLVKPFTIDQLHESMDLCLAIGGARRKLSNVVDFASRRRRAS